MADNLVYLYAVGDAVLGETVPPGLTGVGGDLCGSSSTGDSGPW